MVLYRRDWCRVVLQCVVLYFIVRYNVAFGCLVVSWVGLYCVVSCMCLCRVFLDMLHCMCASCSIVVSCLALYSIVVRRIELFCVVL